MAELRGDIAAAEAGYRRAVEIVEELRRTLESNELKAWVLARKRRPYEALFSLYARQGRGRDALAVLEQARARSLLDALIARTRESSPASDDGRMTRAGSRPPSAHGSSLRCCRP